MKTNHALRAALHPLTSLAGLGALTVRVEFHPPVPFSRFGSRKALSEHCHRAVAEGVDRAIRGK